MSKVRPYNVEGKQGKQGPLVRIGELARRAGIPPATLRAWERRYGVVVPLRGESGYRLYSIGDERRLRRMVELIGTGLAPAEAALRVSSRADESAVANGDAVADAGLVEGFREALALALSRFDDRGADHVLDRAVAILSIDALIDELLLPVLRGLEEDTIGQEHFASNLVRGRLLALARGWGGGDGRLAVLACPGGEQHDLGLIAFGLALRGRGWRIAFLGANTPVEALLAATEEMRPQAVVLCAMTRGVFDGTEPALARLGERARLHLGGPGASEQLSGRLGAVHLGSGPVKSADLIAA